MKKINIVILFLMSNTIIYGSKENENKFKLGLLGNSAVGKTSIRQRFLNEEVNENYKTTFGVNLINTKFSVNGQECSLIIYDTTGQEKFRSIISSHYKNINIFLLVYDVTDKGSFESLATWLEGIKEKIKTNLEDKIVFVVGNKKDDLKERAVSEEEGKKFTDENGFFFAEVSAKTKDGIDNLFKNIKIKICEKFLKMDLKDIVFNDANPNKNANSNKSSPCDCCNC